MLDGLVDLLEETPDDPSAWVRLLDVVASDFSAHGAILLPLAGRVPGTAMTSSLEPLAHDYFHGGWVGRDERIYAMPKLVRTGVATDQDVFTSDEMRRSPYWTEFLEPHGLRWFAGVRVQAADDLWCLALQRRPDQGPFTPDEQARLLPLAATLSRSATIARRLGDARLDGFSGALEFLGAPAFVADRTGRIVRHNAEAEALLGGVLDLSTGELSVVGRRDISAALRRHIDAVIRSGPGSGPGAQDGVAVPRTTGSPLLLRAYPLHRTFTSYFTGARALVLATDPDLRPAPLRSVLRALYTLSDSEARLVQALAQGHGLMEASARIGVTYNTARTYLRSIFAKTGARGQSDLTTIAARLAGPARGALD